MSSVNNVENHTTLQQSLIIIVQLINTIGKIIQQIDTVHYSSKFTDTITQ